MNVEIMPADLKTVTLQVRKIGDSKKSSFAFPREIVDRYDLKDKEKIVIAFICRAGEDCNNKSLPVCEPE